MFASLQSTTRRPSTRPFTRLGALTLLLGMYSSSSAYGPFLAPATGVIQTGDTVELNQPVSSTSGARLYLQKGQVVARGGLRHREPYCYFFLRRDSAVIETGFDLTPGQFEITGLWSGVEYGMQHEPSILFARFPFNTQDASAENMTIRLELSSPDQPEVMSLKCGVFAVPNERNHLSLGEIEQALGDIVTLRMQSE